MSTPNKDFRENPSRAIYVTGKADQSMVDRLTPIILKLRAESSDAITVYIDSPGGNTYHSELIYQLLKTPDQDGHSCRVITVATGTAASAAADLLSSGDYAIAYPHARVMYHGTRRVTEEVLTREGASTLAEALRLANEGYAFRLADRSIDRVIFQFFMVRSEYGRIRREAGNTGLTDAACFAIALREKLRPQLWTLTDHVLEQQRQYQKLRDFVDQRLEDSPVEGRRPAERDADILRAIVDFELQENPDETWSFSAAGLSKVQADFMLLRDYHSREHQSRRDFLARRWGEYLLTQDEQTEYATVPESDKLAWVVTKTVDRIHPLSYFFISICRRMQEGEYNLSATDAYWLGLVDEVVGSGHPCFRVLVEDTPQKETTATINPTPAPVSA